MSLPSPVAVDNMMSMPVLEDNVPQYNIDQELSMYIPYVSADGEFIKDTIEDFGFGKVKRVDCVARGNDDSTSMAFIHMEHWEENALVENFCDKARKVVVAVLDPAVAPHHAGPDHCRIRIFVQKGNQPLDAVFSQHGITVKQHHNLSGCQAKGLVVGPGETQVLPVFNQPDLFSKSFSNRRRTTVPGAVVHDKDFIRVPRYRPVY